MKYFFFIFLILSFINKGFAASLLSFDGGANLNLLYFKHSTNGIHLPIYLNMDEKMKNSICNQIIESDLLQSQGYRQIDVRNPVHLDFLNIIPCPHRYYENVYAFSDLLCPVDVEYLYFRMPGSGKTVYYSDVMMECLAMRYDRKDYGIKRLVISYAFMSHSFFVSRVYPQNLQLIAMGDLSPTYVNFTTEELENYYLKSRLPIEKLREKWPNLVKSLETNDPLSLVTQWTKYKLCMSIFDVDFYRQKSIVYKDCIGKDCFSDGYKIRPLIFATPYLDPPDMETENIICYAQQYNSKIQFFVTRAYDYEYSAFVQRQQSDGKLFLDAYIKDIPFLMNAFKPEEKTIDFDLL